LGRNFWNIFCIKRNNPKLKTMKNLRQILFISLLLFISCSLNDLNPPKLIRDLPGEWDWLISSGGIAGATYTPESVGYSEHIAFTSDSIFRMYRNDSLIMETRYHVIRSTSIYTADTVQLLVYDSLPIRQYFFFSNDDRFGLTNVLNLADECDDCFLHEYVRIK
jgi:hypothetical protein